MSVYYNEYLAQVYASVFDFQLSHEEMAKWAIGTKKFPKMKVRVDQKFKKQRKEREKISKMKKLKLLKVLKLLKNIDTIEAVFLTGSVANGNATVSSDIDLMIVTKPQTVWRTRLNLIRTLRKLNLQRDGLHISDRICTNIYLDRNYLEIQNKNVYTAHEVVSAKCIYDKGGIEKLWKAENKWVRYFMPNVWRGFKGSHHKQTEQVSLYELMVFLAQFLYMKPKMTNEKVGLGYAFFHPRDGEYYVTKFRKKLEKLEMFLPMDYFYYNELS